MKKQRRCTPQVRISLLSWSVFGAAAFLGQAIDIRQELQAKSIGAALLGVPSEYETGEQPKRFSLLELLQARTRQAKLGHGPILVNRPENGSSHDSHDSETDHKSSSAEAHDGHEDHDHEGKHDDHGAAHDHDEHGSSKQKEQEEHAQSDEHSGDSKDNNHEEHAKSDEHSALSETNPPPPGAGEAHSVAVGLIAAVVLMPIGLSMALMPGLVQELTLKMVDTFISIFLAVLWFNCFTQFLVSFKIAQAFTLAAEILSFGQIVILYIIANIVAYLWKDDDMRVTTFCSCSAHFIAFAGIAATGQAQAATMEYFPDLLDPIAVWAFVGLVGLFLFVMFVSNKVLWRNRCKEYDLMQESIDELELDVVGLVISFLATQSMRVLITGSYPEHFLLLQLGFGGHGGGGGNGHGDESGEEGHSNKRGHHTHHEEWQRWFMFFYALVLCIVTSLAMPRLNALVRGNETMSKFVHVTKVILIMLIAWGFLLWGQWEFYENYFRGDPLFGELVFAFGATFTCLFFLYMMGTMAEANRTPETHQTFSIATTGISLVAAWSWEHCFDTAFDIIGEEYQVGYQGFVPKLVLSIVIPLALLPMYLQHVRPRVREIDVRYHKEHEGHEHGHEHGHEGIGEHGHGHGHSQEAAPAPIEA
mmetsp:Transcript_91479/g.191213  ORF Transcript_91479/g.191213 Transcript_91479/m.191213 type:complete len:645 (-) Transcript_91479:583-2517(-)